MNSKNDKIRYAKSLEIAGHLTSSLHAKTHEQTGKSPDNTLIEGGNDTRPIMRHRKISGKKPSKEDNRSSGRFSVDKVRDSNGSLRNKTYKGD